MPAKDPSKRTLITIFLFLALIILDQTFAYPATQASPPPSSSSSSSSSARQKAKESYRRAKDRQKAFEKDGRDWTREISGKLTEILRLINQYYRENYIENGDPNSIGARMVPMARFMSWASDMAAPFVVYYYFTIPLKRAVKDISYMLDSPWEFIKYLFNFGKPSSPPKEEPTGKRSRIRDRLRGMVQKNSDDIRAN